MALKSREVRVCNFKAKWGSCDSSGVLSFNWRLLMAPQWVARYVVVHELAHLKEKAHDKAFYALCTYMEPDYHQLEFDLRLLLTHQAQATSGAATAPAKNGS